MSKLTLVSVSSRGQRVSVFVQGVQGSDGKTRVSSRDLSAMLRRLGVGDGVTYSVGS